jgi:NADH dehydrogenase/putative oxidoreductase
MNAHTEAPPVAARRVAARARLIEAASLTRDLFRFADRGLGPVLDLVIRLWLAQMFWVSGIIKVANWDNALELARSEYPVSWLDPVTAAYTGAAIELIAPVLLAVGLATRAAAIPLLILSLVIQFAYKELPEHLFWAILLGWFVVKGPGRISLDALIAPQLERLALPFAGLAKRLVAFVTTFGGPLYQLFIRLWMAELFFASGLTKIASWELTVALFEDEYKVPLLAPALAALLSTAAELVCPILLAIGLASRFAALPLIAVTLVIQFSYLDKAEHFFWMMLLAQIALRGPGALSVDALIQRFAGRFFAGLDGQPLFPLDLAPKVVIVGAGFGGLACARALRRTAANVTVIDRRNYHLFQPLLYQVATASLSPADIAVPIRELLREQRNTRVLMGRVTGIDTMAREVVLGEKRVPYDYLVLATGARHSYFGRDDWADLAPGLKKIDDATQIRGRILAAFEAAEATDDPAERRRLLTFVLVGAGPTGVELAGAIVELARFGMERDFRNFDPRDARVILVQSGGRVLPAFGEDLSAKALAQLEALGVEVRLNGRVKEIDGRGVTVNGEKIEAGTILWSAGVMASPAAKWLGTVADKAGRVIVGTDLSIKDHAEIFALGDTAAVTGPDGEPVPGLAPAAKQGGEYAARVIRARIEGRDPPPPFRYRHMGSMATIGRKAAIAHLGPVKLSGMLAWWFWGLVHVAFLAGARNRIGVMLDWAWAYVTYRRGTRLITGGQ